MGWGGHKMHLLTVHLGSSKGKRKGKRGALPKAVNGDYVAIIQVSAEGGKTIRNILHYTFEVK